MAERMFPMHPDSPGDLREVPWALLAGHERQAERNHNQSLERLAQRQGLDPREMLAVLKDRPWEAFRDWPLEVCLEQIRAAVAALESTG